jgi:hypothetical protein
MALHYTRRLTPAEIETDQATLVAVSGLTDYAPTNAAYGTRTVSTLETAMEQAQREETRLLKALAAARDAAMAAEWALHEAILGVKRQVLAQYGPDSDAIHTLGHKKRVEKKRPVRRKAA